MNDYTRAVEDWWAASKQDAAAHYVFDVCATRLNYALLVPNVLEMFRAAVADRDVYIERIAELEAGIVRACGYEPGSTIEPLTLLRNHLHSVGVAAGEAGLLYDRIAELEAANKRFPIMDGPSLPWAMLEPHERQAQRNHGQTLTRLAERGGLSCSEALAVLEDRRWKTMPDSDAHEKLCDALAVYENHELRAELEAETKRGVAMSAEIEVLCNERDALKRRIDGLCSARLCSEFARVDAEVKEARAENKQLKKERDLPCAHRLEAERLESEIEKVRAERDALRAKVGAVKKAAEPFVDCVASLASTDPIAFAASAKWFERWDALATAGEPEETGG